MELYKIIATINNTAETFTLQYIPENFEGVKISQKFSFVNPIGFTPKFSIDTMKIIMDDKTTIDEVFDTYGLESDVQFDIYKLNATATDYDLLSSFAIDFESYEKFDVYSEFALKSISTIDFYNRIKDSTINLPLIDSVNFTFPLKLSNRLSLEYNGNTTKSLSTLSLIYDFSQIEYNKIFNSDTSCSPYPSRFYQFGANTTTANVFSIKNMYGTVTVFSQGGNMGTAKIVICKNSLSTILYTVCQNTGINSLSTTLTLPSSFDIPAQNYSSGDYLFMALIITAQSGHTITDFSAGSGIWFQLKKKTDIYFVSGTTKIKYKTINEILDLIFDNNIASSLNDKFSLTSDNSLSNKSDFAIIKPTEFLRDVCLSFGLLLNFKNDGSVEIDTISNFFTALLNVANAVEITYYKDLSIKYGSDFKFSNVNVGHEAIEYDYAIYDIDWTKILNFLQENRNGENLDLTLTRFRTDFIGFMFAIKNRYQNKDNKADDNFFFDNTFSYRTESGGEYIYDVATPRDILTNFKKFLSFAFQNFNKNTLTIGSNGGTVDNLEISGVAQMDDLVLNETPRLLPIEYNFTALLPEIDFSEKILKINDNGSDVYIFVVNAETTDTLSEQKIRGLKIQL